MEFYKKLVVDDVNNELNDLVRWNGIKKLHDETVREHSYTVTFFARILAEELFDSPEIKLEIVTYAMLHDFSERYTGDINHLVKYNLINGDLIRTELDKYISNQVGIEYPKGVNRTCDLMNAMVKGDVKSYVRDLVKVCDWMSMLSYLRKEQSIGNSTVEKMIDYCIEKLENSVRETLVSLTSQDEYDVNIDYLK